VGADLVPSNNVISNCEVYGGFELITLYRGATGVTVTNNYLHDYMFVGIRCGADFGYQFDCYMNNFTNNLITNPWWYSSSVTDVNNAGILHVHTLFNPGTQQTTTRHSRSSLWGTNLFVSRFLVELPCNFCT